jgi:ribosome-associated protein
MKPGGTTAPYRGPVTGAAASEGVRVNKGLVIPFAELTWRFTGSGGPGGQHANTSNTKVELLFDVTASPTLGPRQRAKLIERLGAEVRITASDTRSQTRNRELALDRMAAKLAEALREQTPRRATKPTRAAKRARVDSKRKRGDTKVKRRRPGLDD